MKKHRDLEQVIRDAMMGIAKNINNGSELVESTITLELAGIPWKITVAIDYAKLPEGAIDEE